MKIMALYLPQFHKIKENDEWWGNGYTEWVAVKSAKKYYKKHNQPRVPWNNNYYDLLLEGRETWLWQSKLMSEYGIDGLCIYHYWFNGKMLLEKPMEILLNNKDILIPYCICWANETWTRNWDGGYKKVLMEQTYGGKEDWKKHLDYLFPFFCDERYIKIDNKPVVNLYKSREIPKLKKMMDYWNNEVKKKGFDGIYWISAMTSKDNDDREELFDKYYFFEPGYTIKNDMKHIDRVLYLIRIILFEFINKVFKKKYIARKILTKKLWGQIEKREYNEKKYIGTFPGWDNTPRRKNKGTICEGGKPELFAKHLEILNKKVSQNDYLYINAWNEWGEGAYLEPDIIDKYGYLCAIKKAKKNEYTS